MCKFIIYSLVIVAAFLPTGSGLAQDRHAGALGLKGHLAPDFDLPVLEGLMFDARDKSFGPKRVKLHRERGKVVVLNFFATWCTPCKVEHPFLVSVRRAYAPRGVELYSILVEDSPKNGRRYIADGNRGVPILIGNDTDVAKEYGVGKGVPVTFVIDRTGMIRQVILGGLISPTKLSAALDSVLAAK